MRTIPNPLPPHLRGMDAWAQILILPLLAVWLEVSYSTSLGLSFFTYEIIKGQPGKKETTLGLSTERISREKG